MQLQYLDWIVATRRTVSDAELDASFETRRSGGSPIRVLVTARADLEMERKLYPPWPRNVNTVLNEAEWVVPDLQADSNLSGGKVHEHVGHMSITSGRDEAAPQFVAGSSVKSSRDCAVIRINELRNAAA
jgi:hypothetical protein